MLDPDVTLTDYALAIECGLFVYLLCKAEATGGSLRLGFCVFYAGMGAASLLGGTLHGFAADPDTAVYRLLWTSTLIALGVTTLAGWFLGSRVLFSNRGTLVVMSVASPGFVAYSICTMFFSQEFLVAIVNYLPSALFALTAFTAVALRDGEAPAWLGVVGMVMIFVGAAVQQAGIGLHPEYFDHNAVYHVIQGLAILCVFLFARWIAADRAFRPVLQRASA
jgi:hypothetical protein